MHHEGSIVRRRVLAGRLRRMREEAGLTLEEAAPLLDFSVSKLSRVELGQVMIDVHWVKSMLDVYDAGGAAWTDVMDLARQARRQGWWRSYRVGNTDYVAFEAEARRLRELAVGYVPGLLQTADHARALMASGALRRTADELDRDVAVRLHRQRRLTSPDDPLELLAVVDESVLHRPVGGREVHRAQLERLVEAMELPSVTLQVVPFAAGAVAAVPSGFMLLDYGDLAAPDVAFVEHHLGSVLLDKAEEAARARLAFERITAAALAPDASLALVRRVLGT